VLQALGLPPDAINSFVLEMDPVPRALLSVDPTFQALSVSDPFGTGGGREGCSRCGLRPCA
jgi:hypothetical protein